MYKNEVIALDLIAGFLLKHRKGILITVILLLILSFIGMTFVNINYNLTDYLPIDAHSVKTLNFMEEHLHEGIPNLNVYIPDVKINQALDYKEQLKAVEGVEAVLWLDDAVDVLKPIAIYDESVVQTWYKDGGARFILTVSKLNTITIIENIKQIVGQSGLLSGEALNLATIQTVTMKEISKIMFFVVPLVLIILLFATRSWVEPVLFLITIGVAILLNEGTNILSGEVSYVTQATAAILQLAVSMDYAIFLLHRFNEEREHEKDVLKAMRSAMIKSASTIVSSAMTTVFGFLTLTLMRFRIGPDMGIVLAKGVLFSLLSVMVVLPVLTVLSIKLIDKTAHRSFVPSFKTFGVVVTKICIPVSAVIGLLLLPGYLASQNNNFVYGSSGMHSEDSTIAKNTEYMNSIFGKSQQLVLFVPEGDPLKEKVLNEHLKDLDNITSVISYAEVTGWMVPPEFMSDKIMSNFFLGGYSRFVLTGSVSEEGTEAFKLVEDVRAIVDRYYPDIYYFTGTTVVNTDLKNTITKDTPVVNIAAVIAIGLVLMLNFKSLIIPLILLLTIEGAIWINLGIPYFANNNLNYVGYQIISAVQLGATVDYGILFTQHYLDNRKLYMRYDAARRTLSGTAASILTPAGILFTAGMVLGVISTNGIISQLGVILGRGALISLIMVCVFLPSLLILCDDLIRKTTIGLSFTHNEIVNKSKRAIVNEKNNIGR